MRRHQPYVLLRRRRASDRRWHALLAEAVVGNRNASIISMLAKPRCRPSQPRPAACTTSCRPTCQQRPDGTCVPMPASITAQRGPSTCRNQRRRLAIIGSDVNTRLTRYRRPSAIRTQPSAAAAVPEQRADDSAYGMWHTPDYLSVGLAWPVELQRHRSRDRAARTRLPNPAAPAVRMSVTGAGYFFHWGDLETGPFASIARRPCASAATTRTATTTAMVFGQQIRSSTI